MSRHIATVEDDYTHRVKGVLFALKREWSEWNTLLPFCDWLEKEHTEVAKAFLDDIDRYCGLAELLNELEEPS